jgi:hypothetical protein
MRVGKSWGDGEDGREDYDFAHRSLSITDNRELRTRRAAALKVVPEVGLEPA